MWAELRRSLRSPEEARLGAQAVTLYALNPDESCLPEYRR